MNNNTVLPPTPFPFGPPTKDASNPTHGTSSVSCSKKVASGTKVVRQGAHADEVGTESGAEEVDVLVLSSPKTR